MRKPALSIPLCVAFLSCLFLVSCVTGPESGPESGFANGHGAHSSQLTLDRIFSDGEFKTKTYGQALWLDQGTGYTTLELPAEKDGGKDIVRYDPATGAREILVPADKLVPANESKALAIASYAWTSDLSKVLIFTNTKKVWRRNTRGDYWVLDRRTWKLEQLGGEAAPSTLMFAKFSPDGKSVAYVRENNLYLERLEDHTITQLTSDGGPTLINGTFDWVYEEELSLRDGFRFSPDGTRVAYWQLDTEGVRDYYMLNTTDDLYSRVIPVQYPKVGETNSACRVGVVSVKGGDTRWFQVEGDPRNHYIARMDWAESAREIVLQQLNRLQNTNKVMLGDADTGKVRTVLVEKDDAWVEVGDDLVWLDAGQAFTWVSERDGWSHVYKLPRAGGEGQLLTPGDFDVISVEHVDDQGGWFYFIASPDHPGQRFLYRAPLDGSGLWQRLTPANLGGSNSYRISGDGQWAFHVHSAFGAPPTVSLVRLPGHERVRLLEGNEETAEKIAALDRGDMDFFQVKIQPGVALDGWCMKPPGFDPGKRYPTLVHVYGEPAGQTVLDRWGGDTYLWHLLLTQKGYVVLSVDNRGTPAPRGRAWRKCVYRQVGILAPKDQAAALRGLMKRWPWIDPSRIGIWGWSGGGSMTLNAMFKFPGLYHTGMAIATVSNQRFYDTIYQERYMGLPEDNEKGFKEGSPVHFAHQLEGNLLVIHGTGDDNCHYQSLEAVANALIRANKHFTMMAYPNRGHSIYQGKNTRRHLFGLLTRYLMENLEAGPRE